MSFQDDILTFNNGLSADEITCNDATCPDHFWDDTPTGHVLSDHEAPEWDEPVTAILARRERRGIA